LVNALNLENELLSFKFVNLASAIIFSITIYAIARNHEFSIGYSLLTIFLSGNLFFSPARFTPFYPAYTDPTFLALTAISVLLFLRKSYLLSLLLIAVAYPIREAALFVLFFLAGAAIYIEGWSRQLLYKIIGAIVFVLVIKFSIRHYYLCDGSQIRTAISWIYQRLANPERFVSYCAAILILNS